MPFTLLLDLDDTLLENNIDSFMPGYTQALGRQLAPFVSPEKMIPQLLRATRAMIKKKTPALTLEETFDRVFYPELGLNKEDLKDSIQSFYQDVFPSLQSLTSSRPQAVQMVEKAFEKGYQIVIATNPLFPRAAILHRLKWAGLDPDRYPFALITDFETFHFAKPHPSYYLEILATLGWPESSAGMVGNSLEEDMLPAIQAGLKGFYLQESSISMLIPPGISTGSLDSIVSWADSAANEEIEPAFLLSRLIGMLNGSAAAIDTICRTLPPSAWNRKPQPHEWSITEIVCHLADADTEVNLPRLIKVCQEENPFLPGIPTDPWAEERQYNSQNGPASLNRFLEIRTQLNVLLESLAISAWDRPANHAIFGPTTLRELVHFITLHDQSHLQQILRTRELIVGP
jgi:FMN phosphatase YigB (HAD superfamily)